MKKELNRCAKVADECTQFAKTLSDLLASTDWDDDEERDKAVMMHNLAIEQFDVIESIVLNDLDAMLEALPDDKVRERRDMIKELVSPDSEADELDTDEDEEEDDDFEDGEEDDDDFEDDAGDELASSDDIQNAVEEAAETLKELAGHIRWVVAYLNTKHAPKQDIHHHHGPTINKSNIGSIANGSRSSATGKVSKKKR